MPSVTDLVESLTGQGPKVKVRNVHQMSVRLSTDTYAALLALAEVLPEGHTSLARMFLEVSVQEAVEALPDGTRVAYDEMLERVLEKLDIQEGEE